MAPALASTHAFEVDRFDGIVDRWILWWLCGGVEIHGLLRDQRRSIVCVAEPETPVREVRGDNEGVRHILKIRSEDASQNSFS